MSSGPAVRPFQGCLRLSCESLLLWDQIQVQTQKLLSVSPSKGPRKVTVRRSLDSLTVLSVIGDILWKHLELSRNFGISPPPPGYVCDLCLLPYLSSAHNLYFRVNQGKPHAENPAFLSAASREVWRRGGGLGTTDVGWYKLCYLKREFQVQAVYS